MDLCILLALGSFAAFASLKGASLFDPVIFDWETVDCWFEGDIARAFSNMTRLHGDHSRASVHPLFSLAAYTAVRAIRFAVRVDPATAVRILMAAAAVMCSSAFYLLLRCLGQLRLAAALFTVLAGTSACAVFWFVVPETYPFGLFSILLAILAVALSERRRLGAVWFTRTSAATMAMTITNWMAGILAAFVRLPRRKAVLVTVNAFAIVLALWCVQKYFFRSTGFFPDPSEERNAFLRPESGGPPGVLSSFFFHSIVAPEFREEQRNPDRPEWPSLLTQGSSPGSAGAWGVLAAISWAILLALGVWGFFRADGQRSTRLVIGAGVPAEWLGQRMSVRGLPARLGRVDWAWDETAKRMRVRVDGLECPVRLGPAFPARTELQVEFVRR